jgi:hypothetical protein
MVRLWETPTPTQHNNTTTLTFLDWKRQGAIFEALSVEESVSAAVATGADPVRLSGKLVSADYFSVFGVKARFGRTFALGEDQPGATPVVVLSYSSGETARATSACLVFALARSKTVRCRCVAQTSRSAFGSVAASAPIDRRGGHLGERQTGRSALQRGRRPSSDLVARSAMRTERELCVTLLVVAMVMPPALSPRLSRR